MGLGLRSGGAIGCSKAKTTHFQSSREYKLAWGAVCVWGGGEGAMSLELGREVDTGVLF